MTKQELKDSVADVIKTNGENEITGANLQTKLFEIIDECYGGTSSLYQEISGLGDVNLSTIDGTETLAISSNSLTEAFQITLVQLRNLILIADNPYTNGIVFITESRDLEANDEGKLLAVVSESEVILTMPEGQIFQGGKISMVFFTEGGYQAVPNGNIIYPFVKQTFNGDENTQCQFLQFFSYYNDGNSGLVLISSTDGFILDPLDNSKSISVINYLMRVISTGLQGVTDVGSTTTSDIEITDFNKGIILTASDSSRWRVTVDTSGNLVSTSI